MQTTYPLHIIMPVTNYEDFEDCMLPYALMKLDAEQASMLAGRRDLAKTLHRIDQRLTALDYEDSFLSWCDDCDGLNHWPVRDSLARFGYAVLDDGAGEITSHNDDCHELYTEVSAHGQITIHAVEKESERLFGVELPVHLLYLGDLAKSAEHSILPLGGEISEASDF